MQLSPYTFLQMAKYNYIISLGRDCACTSFMQRQNLRYASFPFDWLTAVELAPRLDLLLNEFEDFLHLQDLRYLEKPTGIVGDAKCDNYQNVRNGFIYYHDFPAGIAINQSYLGVKEKYDRRIERMLSILKSSKSVLLVWYAHEPLLSSAEEIVQYRRRITKKYGERIDLLIIENDLSVNPDDYEIEDLGDGVCKIRANTKPDNRTDRANLGNVKVGDRIFNEQCVLKYRNIFLFMKTLRKRVIKLASLALFFNRDLRRAFRKKHSEFRHSSRR